MRYRLQAPEAHGWPAGQCSVSLTWPCNDRGSRLRCSGPRRRPALPWPPRPGSQGCSGPRPRPPSAGGPHCPPAPQAAAPPASPWWRTTAWCPAAWCTPSPSARRTGRGTGTWGGGAGRRVRLTGRPPSCCTRCSSCLPEVCLRLRLGEDIRFYLYPRLVDDLRYVVGRQPPDEQKVNDGIYW
jgi:hypothetical protein